MDERIWTIPAKRTKGKKRAHRVPLADRAVEILKQFRQEGADDGFVFPGFRRGRPLSNTSMEMLIKSMNDGSDPPFWNDPTDGRAIVPHGFRSTARDWCSETTAFPSDVCEMALHHTIENKVEAAYRRGDLFEKRSKLMEEWADFCLTPQTADSPIQKKADGENMFVQRVAA